MSVALALLTLTSSRSSPTTGARSASTSTTVVVSSLGGTAGGTSPLRSGAGEGEGADLRVRGAMMDACGVYTDLRLLARSCRSGDLWLECFTSARERLSCVDEGYHVREI